jgi:dethiobiotin synthetase
VKGIIQRHDVTLIEGAGGLLVPVALGATYADLAREWQLPVIVVVGNRLGCLNHAQLTVGWARRAGLDVAGYVVNTLSAENDIASRTNVEALTNLLGSSLGVMPWLGTVACTAEDRCRLAAAARESLDIAGLLART